MKHVITSQAGIRNRGRRGFALLITITLLAFLVLLLVSLASLTRVETQVAGNGQRLGQARQNALMSLNVAIAQLQKTVGPDQRTTVRADFGNGTSGNTLPLAVNGAKQWTGAVGNTVVYSTTFTQAPVVLNWLVSGNEGATFTPSTSSATFGQITVSPPASGAGAITYKPDGVGSLTLSTSTTATTPLSNGTTAYQLLVGANTVGTTAGVDQYVVAPLVAIASSQVPGVSGSPTIGRYAYWVGDEGIKARINLNNPYTSSSPRSGYQVAQRVATEMIDDDNSFSANGTNLKAAFPVNNSVVSSVISGGQFSFLGTTAANQTTLGNAQKIRFHDITTSSNGVLSDSLRGGLKKDLTAAFAYTLSSDNTSLVASGYGSNATYLSKAGNILWSDPVWDLSSATKTPPGAIPTASDGSPATAWISTSMASNNGYDGKGPLWQLLRSYYQLPDNPAAAFSGSGASATMNPLAQTGDSAGTAQQHGVAPVMVGYQLFIDAKVADLGGGNYQLEMRHVPAITLWNPYDVTLKSQAYHVTISLPKSIFYARVVNASATPTYNDPAITANAQVSSPYFYDSTGNTALGTSVDFTFTLESGAMAPGTAYAYTMAADLAATATSVPSPLPALVRGWGAGPSNGKGVVVTSGSFALPGVIAPNKYYFVFFLGGTGRGSRGDSTPEPGITTMPAWDGAPVQTTSGTTPAVPPLDYVFLRMGSATGDIVQQVSGNNPNLAAPVSTWPNTTSTGYKDITSNKTAQFCYPWKVALQVTAQSPLTTSSTMPPVRWLSGYNPRAYQSYRSAFEIQSAGGTGYQNSNPSYARQHPLLTKTTATTSLNYTVTADSDTFAGPDDVTSGIANFGYDYSASSGPVILYAVPRPDSSILSLGALQHANLYRTLLESAPNPYRLASNFAPAYPIGNSWADIRVPLSAAAGSIKPASGNKITGFSNVAAVFFDHSFLLNRTLWDAYFFSGISAGGSAKNPDGSLNTQDSRLVTNAASFGPADLHNTDRAAAGLLTTGAFNINSTSVDAWRAVLAGTLNVPVGSTARTDEAPVPRLLYPVDANVMTAPSNASSDSNTYQGYRFLTRDQIDSLATAIVTEVKNRGPFLSLADFVNRSLVNVADGLGFDERTMGPLARALQVVQESVSAKQPNGAFAPGGTNGVEIVLGSGSSSYSPMPGATGGTSTTTTTTLLATGAPGFITQADLLQPLGPVLSARSDTFVIRAYGDAVNPLGSSSDSDYVQSRAWCEAVVQRMPEYVDATQDAWDFPSAAHAANQTFGRRFKIISFKWLSPSDI